MANYSGEDKKIVSSSYLFEQIQLLYSKIKTYLEVKSIKAENYSGGSAELTGSFGINRKPESIVGVYSFAEGENCVASKEASHAEGCGTQASGVFSHAEGNDSIASGDCSHAEGSGTTARGSSSHAEGDSTAARGTSSHAEGESTVASGYCSHAEGYSTTASNNQSHAEGDCTNSNGSASHSEGEYTTASGEASHAEGHRTTASGAYSHAEGYSSNKISNVITDLSSETSNNDIITAWNSNKFSLAKETSSHAEGQDCLALSGTSHAEGNCTTASGDSSHSEGYRTKAVGYAGHAEGFCTKSSGSQSSHAEGSYTLASGNFGSHAEGSDTTASGACSHAEGKYTKSNGYSSHAEGEYTTTSGEASHSEGYRTTASGVASHAEGSNIDDTGKYTYSDRTITISDDETYTIKGSTAYGVNSHAEGCQTFAYKYCSHAEGSRTKAIGYVSHAEGSSTIADGQFGHAEGCSTTASNYASHASGKYNVSMTTGGAYNNTVGTAFVIGNGTGDSALSNAFSVQFDGTVKAKSTITASTTADYAEFFEWLDKNKNSEDRVGYFVTLEDDKIRIATNKDDYILGIVSGEPFVLGNGDCDTWNGMYLHDEFRRTIYEPAPKMIEVEDKEEFEEEYIDDETGETKTRKVERIIGTHWEEAEGEFEGTRPVLNPDYDPSQKYISRFDRPEWSPVGMLGVLAVHQDGTLKVNGYATVNENGIATACQYGNKNSYRVIRITSDKVAEVIFR